MTGSATYCPRGAGEPRTIDDWVGMAWWNFFTETERARWLARACTPRPIDAWRAYKRASSPPGTSPPDEAA